MARLQLPDYSPGVWIFVPSLFLAFPLKHFSSESLARLFKAAGNDINHDLFGPGELKLFGEG
jgi:hypothetical protein